MDSSAHLGVMSIERFLAVERYRDSHRTVASTHPLPTTGPVGRGGRTTADRPRSDGGSAKVR
jgi:hypothetical protein